MVIGPSIGPAHHGPRCDIAWERGPQAVRRLVVCVAKELPNVEVDDALRRAGCESGFRARAYNGDGPYGGVYQQLIPRWPVRARLFGFAGRPWWDAEANVWVSLRSVRYSGWGPWGCQ